MHLCAARHFVSRYQTVSAAYGRLRIIYRTYTLPVYSTLPVRAEYLKHGTSYNVLKTKKQKQNHEKYFINLPDVGITYLLVGRYSSNAMASR